ncbi:epoxide hydrolase family protein [Streptomyces chartreusis]|uniref:epoxide hydrolase family protein n=1 Tax=Streptomyces chartreusis TaxID=1969 RepID=UPI00369280B5
MPTRQPSIDLRPFTPAIDEPVLADLRERLARTRLPEASPGPAWSQGTDHDYLQDLLGYWRDEYDWANQASWLNGFDHYRADIDGDTIHFVHQRASAGNGVPLILTHGWPSTFAEYLDVVPLLTDPQRHGLPGPAFDVVIPSLPGYIYSPRPAVEGVNYRYVAHRWHQLMRGLGYTRYGAAGGDFGSGISTYMALEDPDALLGIYLSHLEIQPTLDADSTPLTTAEQAYRASNDNYWADEGGYFEIQSTKPQTLGYGLNDSPAGLAAWIVEKWRTWGDTGGDVNARFSRDFLLTTVMLYWATQSITSSMRDYVDDRPWFNHDTGLASTDRVEVSTGFSTWPSYATGEGIPPRSWVERLYNVTHWTDMPSGGHFAAIEEPTLYAKDLTAFFKSACATPHR